METKEENVLTQNQLLSVIIGSFIGVGALILPRDAIKVAKQDGWISTLLGVIYPIYMVLIASYVRKKHPKEDILDLSKKIYGKVIGNILNLLFTLFFFISATNVTAGISNVIRIYIVSFLESWNILSLLFLVTAYVAYKGAKVLGRVNEVLFYITFVVCLVPFFALEKAHVSNLYPIFGTGVKDILRGTKETIIAYSGMEALFILYPFVGSSVNVKKPAFKAVIFTCAVYILFTLITILYLGIDTSLKFLWPVVTVTESISIPIINSFRYIFLSLWTMTMLKCISVHYYLTTYGLSKIFKKIGRNNWVVLCYPLMIIASSMYGSPTMRRGIVGKVYPPYVVYNILFVSITAILIALGKGDNYAKKVKKNNNNN